MSSGSTSSRTRPAACSAVRRAARSFLIRAKRSLKKTFEGVPSAASEVATRVV